MIHALAAAALAATVAVPPTPEAAFDAGMVMGCLFTLVVGYLGGSILVWAADRAEDWWRRRRDKADP